MSGEWRVGWHVIDKQITWFQWSGEQQARNHFELISSAIPDEPKNVWLQRRGADDHWLPVKGPNMSAEEDEIEDVHLDKYLTRREFIKWQQQVESQFMATQDEVDALTQAVGQVATDLASEQAALTTATTNLQNEINNLATGNPALDLTALQAAVAPLDQTVTTLETATNALNSLVPTPPAPAP